MEWGALWGKLGGCHATRQGADNNVEQRRIGPQTDLQSASAEACNYLSMKDQQYRCNSDQAYS
eukprot:3595826-Amphidinium_carterae.1